MTLPDLSSLSVNNSELLEDDEVILTVDDYQAVAVLLQKFLQQQGLTTLTAGFAQEFWQQFKKVPVALVLLDINLPDADGTKLIEIKEASPDTAIIMLSAATDLHTALECLRNGADDYLIKPLQLDIVWQTVRNVLEKRRLQINNRHYQQQLEQANFRLHQLYKFPLNRELFQWDVPLAESKFLEDDEVVLAVDDYQAVVQLLRDFLKNRGLQTLTAGSAQEFWQHFKKVPVALVLLDINLPDADGAKLIPEIKEASPDTAIIMLSAATDLYTALECLRNGADDYLTKPVQLNTFWETTRKVLEKRRLKINNLRYQQQLEQANFRLQKLYDQSKACHPLSDGKPPPWASGWGQDSYGVWVEFTVEGEGKPVTQRMRWIPPGRFVMGSPKDEPGQYDIEGPQHQVTISQGFWLFDTPVTQALWLAVMEENPSEFKSPDRPVEQVSWNDCQDFLKEINRKLPGLDLTLPGEALWEYACRAGSSTALYTGPIEIDDDTAPPRLSKFRLIRIIFPRFLAFSPD